MKLIANWRQSWRLWSVRVSAIGAAIFALLLAAPDFLLSIWNALPSEVQGLVPNSATLGLIMSLAAGVARIVHQRGASASATVADVLALVERVTAAEVTIAAIRKEITSDVPAVDPAHATHRSVYAASAGAAASAVTAAAVLTRATHRLTVDAAGKVAGITMTGSAPLSSRGADWAGVTDDRAG